MGAFTLASYAGKKVRVICLECDILRSFDGDRLIAEFDDSRDMPGLLDDLHARIGCSKPRVGYSGRCALTYHITHEEWVARSGMITRHEHEIALGKRLCDLLEWEFLLARCKCGRVKRLNHAALVRKVGAQTRIKELAAKLRCSGCQKADSVIEISTMPR